MLHPDLFADKQVAGIQGQSEYKTGTGLCKRIGDGLPVNALADDGYTYNFYFCNEPVDEK